MINHVCNNNHVVSLNTLVSRQVSPGQWLGVVTCMTCCEKPLLSSCRYTQKKIGAQWSHNVTLNKAACAHPFALSSLHAFCFHIICVVVSNRCHLTPRTLTTNHLSILSVGFWNASLASSMQIYKSQVLWLQKTTSDCVYIMKKHFF